MQGMKTMELTDQLSQHFSAFELAQHAGGIRTLPVDQAILDNLQRLVTTALEPLRTAWEQFIATNSLGGSPAITVICGWRSAALNAAIGGAQQSQHMLGKAADICCDVDMESLRHGRGTERDIARMATFASFIEKFVDRGDVIGGLGLYSTSGQYYWCHVDIRQRPNGHVARWTGGMIGSEQA
jgi:uncharacterized protein YcbK (DUF882 family)